MVNYIEYHVMGTVSQVRMKPGCTPSKFGCQEDRRKRTCSTERPYILKRQRMITIADCVNKAEESCTPNSSLKDTCESCDTSSDFQTVGENVPEILCEQRANKSVQAFITHKFRSKAVQTKEESVDHALSPLKPPLQFSSTSPFKAGTVIKSSPSVSGPSKITRNVLIGEEHSSFFILQTMSEDEDPLQPSCSNAESSQSKQKHVQTPAATKKTKTIVDNQLQPSCSNAESSQSKQKHVQTPAATKKTKTSAANDSILLRTKSAHSIQEQVNTPPATNETECTSSKRLTNVLCAKCQEEMDPRAVATVLEGQVKSVIANVYHFLEREVQYLTKKYAGLDLSPLKNIRLRAAEATGVSQGTLLAVLKEEKDWYEGGHLEPPEKRPRLDPEDHEIDREYAAASPEMVMVEPPDDDVNKDEDVTETLVIKFENTADDEQMELEAATRNILVKMEPPDDDVTGNATSAAVVISNEEIKIERDDGVFHETATTAAVVISNEEIKTERDDGVFHDPLTHGGMFLKSDTSKLKPEDGGSRQQHSHGDASTTNN